MDQIYAKVLENDFDVSYDEFVEYLRLVFNLMALGDAIHRPSVKGLTENP